MTCGIATVVLVLCCTPVVVFHITAPLGKEGGGLIAPSRMLRAAFSLHCL